jgi:hypothetical protein
MVRSIGDGFQRTYILNLCPGPLVAIRDSVLRARSKSSVAIQAKLSLVYGKDALCQPTVDTWTARFWSRRTLVEDDNRPGRPSSDSLSAAVSGCLNINPHASCRDIAKDLFIPMTKVLRFLDEMGLRFFVTR